MKPSTLFTTLGTVIFAMVLVPRSPAEAGHMEYQQARFNSRVAPIVLTRMCIAETGFARDICAAQIGVIARRARRAGISMSHQAISYSSPLVRPDRLRDNSHFINRVVFRGRERQPEGFPRMSWTRWRSRALEMKSFVIAVLRGEVPDPCEAEQPDHFGSLVLAADRSNVRDNDWEQVCPEVHDRQGVFRSQPMENEDDSAQ